MELNFENKVVMVTGGSFGIGQATAFAFAQSGAKVVIADIVVDKEQQTLNAIKSSGGEAVFIQCDVTQESQVKSLIEKTVKQYGRLDYAFNNAGIEGGMALTHQYTEENWDKVLSINLKGVWLCMKYQIPEILKQGKGAIVNNSSIGGLIGFPGLPAYVASKHAVIGLTKTAALENAKTGLRINAVCPGIIRTQMMGRMITENPELEKQFLALEPMGRMGTPSEVASAVLWLCSDGASFVTGNALQVDGGWLAV